MSHEEKSASHPPPPYQPDPMGMHSPPQGYGAPPPQGYGYAPSPGYGHQPPMHPGYASPQPYYHPPQPVQQQQQSTNVVVVGGGAPAQTIIVNERDRVNHCLHCCISLFFPIWIFVWIGLCICYGC